MLNNVIEESLELFTIKVFAKNNDNIENEIASYIYSLLENSIGSRSAAKANIKLINIRPYWKDRNLLEITVYLSLQDECSPEDIFSTVQEDKDSELYYAYWVEDIEQAPRLVEELIIDYKNSSEIKWIHIYNGVEEPGLLLEPEEWLEATKTFDEEEADEELLPVAIKDYNMGFVDEQSVLWGKGPALNSDDLFEWDLLIPENSRNNIEKYSPDGIHMSVGYDGEPIVLKDHK